MDWQWLAQCCAGDVQLHQSPQAAEPVQLTIDGKAVRIKDGIARFTPDESYSSGNFSTLRERHATLQLDSQNGTHDRLTTFLSRTQWPEDFLRGKTVLECGCGAGPDTEVMLQLGAKVLSVDLAGVDVARRNVERFADQVTFAQASIAQLPFKKQYFDVVFCHRVIMHTPNPPAILDHILQFAKPEGAVFVHSYSKDWFQLLRWKYVLRPLTKRMNPERLYRLIERCAPALYPLTAWMNRNRYSRMLAWFVVPFINHRHHEKYEVMDNATMREYAVHETFDALSPAYDSPLSATELTTAAQKHLQSEWEIFKGRAYILLRSRVVK